MLERDELLKYPNFLLTSYQNEVYNLLLDYMERNRLNKKELAKELGISGAYLSQILNGEFNNFTLKKVIELALKVGKVPYIAFLDTDDYWKRVEGDVGIKEEKEYTILPTITANKKTA